MKLKLLFRIYIFIIFLMSFSNCCLFKKRPDTDIDKDSTKAKKISTGSSYCDYGIQMFNKQASGNIASDINTVYISRGNIPEDMRQFYPAAKIAWNEVLKQIKSNYSATYIETSLEGLTPDVIKDWRNKNLEEYQKFFLLLAEYRYGKYPEETNDVLKRIAWIEKADAKKRFNAYLKAMIAANCYSTNGDLIRKMLNPVFLPDSLEECYK